MNRRYVAAHGQAVKAEAAPAAFEHRPLVEHHRLAAYAAQLACGPAPSLAYFYHEIYHRWGRSGGDSEGPEAAPGVEGR